MFHGQRLSTLVVDDDPDIIAFMSHVLRSAGCDVCLASDGDLALTQAEANHPDVVFLDINIPEQDGWLVCRKLKMLPNAPAIVLITGRTESNTDRFADFVHADGVLRKPFVSADVQRVLKEMCHTIAKD